MACRILLTIVAAGALGAPPLAGQDRGLEVAYGRWWYRGIGEATIMSATHYRKMIGPVGYGIGLVHVADRQGLEDRTVTGGEVSLVVGNRGTGAYAIGAAGVGVRHEASSVDGSWGAGVGYGWSPVRFVRIAAEARYRVEDQNVRGFWRLQPDDRRGAAVTVGLQFRFGRSVPGAAYPVPATDGRAPRDGRFEPPTADDLADLARDNGASGDVAALTSGIVATALEHMGVPYQWGGTGENGFDCSGLIQFSYAQHGIIVPRVSRDQVRTGRFVEPRLDALRPGDILGFSEGGRVSHVGLYVGEGRFIHSSSTGVKLSGLDAADGESRWWRDRWVSARRIVE